MGEQLPSYEFWQYMQSQGVHIKNPGLGGCPNRGILRESENGEDADIPFPFGSQLIIYN